MDYEVLPNLDDIEDRELGGEAIFSISSAKPGNGVEQLRDDNLETYWQSDGTAPHCINVQFLKKTALTKICIYVDHELDDSYTPKRIVISAGSCIHDIVDVVSLPDLVDPSGWVTIDLESCSHQLPGVSNQRSFLKTHFVQIRIQSMHQNGKDTHIRQVKIFGTRESPRVMADLFYDDFKTEAMFQYALLR